MSKVRLAVLSVMVLLATSAIAMADSFMFSFRFGRPVCTYVEYGYPIYEPIPVPAYIPPVVYGPLPVIVYRSPIYSPPPIYVNRYYSMPHSYGYYSKHHHQYRNPGYQGGWNGPRHNAPRHGPQHGHRR